MADRTMIVVADTSGSMREHGKAMLVRGLLAHVRQAAEDVTGGTFSDGLGATPSSSGAPPGAPILVIWGSEGSVLTMAVDEDLPLLPVGGSAAVQPLLALLDSLLVESGRIGLLVLSDGHLPAADVKTFRAWLRRRPEVSVRAIAVGPDAMTANLARLTGGANEPVRLAIEAAAIGGRGWFPPEEIGAALASWPPARPAELPAYLAEVVGDARRDRP
jgi:hypothetical protein